MPSQEHKSHFGLFDATSGGFGTLVAGATGADAALMASKGVVVLNCLLPLYGVDSVVSKGSGAEAVGSATYF